jgi:very-short-patch-repair endonuclease
MPAGESLVGNDARFGTLLKRADDVLANRTKHVLPQHVVQIALALVHTGPRDARARRVWASIAARIAAAALVDEFNPKQISQMAWACSKAPVSMASTMACLAPRAVHCVPDLDSKELAMLVYAFAKAGVSAPRLYAAIARQAEERVGALNAQDLANTAWAFATAGVSAPRLYAVIAQQAEERAETFNAQSLANTAWAFATAGVSAPRLYAAIAQQAEARVETFKARELANTAWALSTSTVLQGSSSSAQPGCNSSPPSPDQRRVVLFMIEQWLACGSVSSDCMSSEIGAVERALLACDVCMNAQRTAAFAADQIRVAELRRQAREIPSRLGSEQHIIESAAQRELSTRLAAAGWAHADEVPLADGLLVVDMACEQTRVVVEFDGPTHYLRDVSSGEETYNGSTRVNTRLLELLGWRVIRVGWREWARGPDARELLVQSLVAAAASERSDLPGSV